MRALAARLRREDGQVISFLAVGMLVVLLGIAGLVVDVGHVYLVKRQLQATADAAALAAATGLPTTSGVASTAASYGPAGENVVAGVTATQSVTTWCLQSVSWCPGGTAGQQTAGTQANGVVVTESASVPTTFMKLFGIDSVPVHARAVACGVCGTTKLDVMLVLDRTGSMSGDMDELKSSVEGFLNSLDTNLDRVGLVVLPPGPACSTPWTGAYPFQIQRILWWTVPFYAYGAPYTSQYLSDPLTSDFQDPSSGVYKDVSCLADGGPTSYLGALQAAYAELQADGRPDAQKAIVFESDGAANDADESAYNQSSSKQFTVGGTPITFYAPSNTTQVLQPCQSAVDYSNSVLKPADVLVYTVGFGIEDPGGDHTCYASPYLTSRGGYVDYRQQAEPNPASWYLGQIATTTDDAYDASKLQPGQLASSFRQIAAKLAGSSLVPDSEAPTG